MTDHQEQDQWSQEFQLLGKLFDDRLNYVFGLYYFTEDGFVHDFVPFQGLLYVYDYQNDVDTESYAAFLHADFEITDKLSVIARRPLHLGGQELHRRPGGPERLHLQDSAAATRRRTRRSCTWTRPSRRSSPASRPRFPGGRPAVPVLPRGGAEAGLQRLHADRRACSINFTDDVMAYAK